MEFLFQSAFRALRSLFAPGMLGVMIKCVLATIVALILFVIGSTMLVGYVTWMLHPTGDTNGIAELVTALFTSIIAWFLFPGIMPVIVNFFGERIMGIIERQDYPAGKPARANLFWPELWYDARFSFITICLNLLVLPLYFIPTLNIFLFYLLNGYLLGREFFVMAARRYMPVDDAEQLRKRYGRMVFLAGIMFTFTATLPIINLFAPFWGIALMTHLYHALAKTPASAILPPA